RRMQAVDFRPALMTVLLEHPPGQMQQLGEARLQTTLLARDLAGDVADSAPEICSERAQRLVGPLELLGVGIALMLDQGELAHPTHRTGADRDRTSGPASPASRAPG